MSNYFDRALVKHVSMKLNHPCDSFRNDFKNCLYVSSHKRSVVSDIAVFEIMYFIVGNF